MFCVPATAVAPTATVTVAQVPGKMLAELKSTVTPAGAFAVSATAFVPAPLSATLMMNAAVLPTCTVPAADEAVIVKSAPATLPEPH